MRPQFFASGVTFDVDGFLAATGLHCDRVFRCGEKYGSGGWPRDHSGFNRWLADESELSLEQQFEVAARFLNENREALSRLRAWPGLDTAMLALIPDLEVTRSVICTKLYAFPASLVHSCAELRLELGLAVRLKWSEECE
jgi:hypothetical protein